MRIKTIVVSGLLILSLVAPQRSQTVISDTDVYDAAVAADIKAISVNNDIFFEDSESGVVIVRYESSAVLKVGIKRSNATEKFYIYKSGEISAYPLTDGDGVYTVTVYENIENNLYIPVLIKSQTVVLNSEFAPYLHSNFYVNYDNGDTVSAAARLISEGKTSARQKAVAIYKYLIRNFSYDKEKSEQIASGELRAYISSPQKTLKSKSGVCCDFSSLYAAMLRSLDIPCKVETGYCSELGDRYHAWNSVYDEESGEWFIVDLTRGIEQGVYWGQKLPARNPNMYDVYKSY